MTQIGTPHAWSVRTGHTGQRITSRVSGRVPSRIASRIPGMIGPIMPMGTVTRSANLLLDCAMMLRLNQGLNRCHATINARNKQAGPIAMSTIAKRAGMLPIHLGLGTDLMFRSPMTVVDMGSLITATSPGLQSRGNARVPAGAENTA